MIHCVSNGRLPSLTHLDLSDCRGGSSLAIALRDNLNDGSGGLSTIKILELRACHFTKGNIRMIASAIQPASHLNNHSEHDETSDEDDEHDHIQDGSHERRISQTVQNSEAMDRRKNHRLQTGGNGGPCDRLVILDLRHNSQVGTADRFFTENFLRFVDVRLGIE